MSYLNIKQLSYAYGRDAVLPALSLDMEAGQFACLLGPSGSGKTTLLRLIAGLEPWQTGTIVLDGVVLSGPHDAVPPERRSIGMVFQQPTLFPTLTAAQNVAFGLRGMPDSEAKERVQTLLEHVGLSDRAHSYPHQLSGGQQHRVALARALAPQVKLLLLDEPFSHLDPMLRLQLSHDTRLLAKRTGVTCLMVTHDAAEAMRLSDRLFLLDASGHLHQSGSPREIYHHPADAYAAQALGEMNLLPAISDGHQVTSVLGVLPLNVSAGPTTLGIRPHDVLLGQSGVSAKVMHIVCMGSEDRAMIRLHSGEEVVATMPYTHPYKVGDVVNVSVREGAARAFS